jgi:hypothetical protein
MPMNKIPTLYVRNYGTDKLVHDETTPGCEWVLAGEGVATRKWDGTCCLVRTGNLFKRYDAKKGKVPPPGFEPCGEPDPVTGHHPGWVPVGAGPEDQWHREALDTLRLLEVFDGTYELLGPKIQGNPEKYEHHVLIRHDTQAYQSAPRSFSELRAWLSVSDIEGLVWHHPDGRMAKIKLKDFGWRRPI